MNPRLTQLLASDHHRELLREAERRRLSAPRQAGQRVGVAGKLDHWILRARAHLGAPPALPVMRPR